MLTNNMLYIYTYTYIYINIYTWCSKIIGTNCLLFEIIVRTFRTRFKCSGANMIAPEHILQYLLQTYFVKY